MQEIHGPLRVCGGLEDRPLVALEGFEPRLDEWSGFEQFEAVLQRPGPWIAGVEILFGQGTSHGSCERGSYSEGINLGLAVGSYIRSISDRSNQPCFITVVSSWLGASLYAISARLCCARVQVT